MPSLPEGIVAGHAARLLARAATPERFDARLFARLLGARIAAGNIEALGLNSVALARLYGHWFPNAAAPRVTQPAPVPAHRLDEVDDVRVLLLEHRSRQTEEEIWLADILAHACLGQNHLWEDLGLADRTQLSELLKRHFAPLAAKNTGGMRWKKFFYKQLCEREGLNLCRAPSCAVCAEHPVCFGPE